MSERREEVIVDETPPVVKRRRRYVRDLNANQRILAMKITQFLWLLFSVLETLLMLRFFLVLLKANPANAFADFVYDVTDIFLWPFLDLFEMPVVAEMPVDVASLIGIVVYSFVGWLITRLVWLVLYTPKRQIVYSSYEETE